MSFPRHFITLCRRSNMNTQVFLVVLAVLGPSSVLASKGNFCKPLLDYTELEYIMENVTVCRTKLEKKCEEVSSNLCLIVTEMECSVELFPNCSMDWELVKGVDFNMTMGIKNISTCDKFMGNETHQKQVYDCHNVTKQHCTTLWTVNAKGEKVWAGNENDCKNVTWQECQPVMINVTIPAPHMNCYPTPYMYPSFVNVTTSLMADTLDCRVERKAVCKPVKTRKCADITYTKCSQVPEDVCMTYKELVPRQEEIHKQWCLLDHNIDLETEVRKIAGNPLNFPFEKVQGKSAFARKPRDLKLNRLFNHIYGRLA